MRLESFIPVNPLFFDVLGWADATSATLFDIPRLDDANAWKEWANEVVGRSYLQGFSPPDASVFETWQEWAERFNDALTSRSQNDA